VENKKRRRSTWLKGYSAGYSGKSDEKPEVEAPEALASAEAFAAAIAAIASREDPGVARKTEEFLSDQSHLLKIQAEHLEDEHALRLAHLRNLLREENVRRLGLRLRVGFQLFLVLVAITIGVGAAIMIRDAVMSRRVVIEPFEVSPNVAARVCCGWHLPAQCHACKRS
jgi:hypothetical protein